MDLNRRTVPIKLLQAITVPFNSTVEQQQGQNTSPLLDDHPPSFRQLSHDPSSCTLPRPKFFAALMANFMSSGPDLPKRIDQTRFGDFSLRLKVSAHVKANLCRYHKPQKLNSVTTIQLHQMSKNWLKFTSRHEQEAKVPENHRQFQGLPRFGEKKSSFPHSKM